MTIVPTRSLAREACRLLRRRHGRERVRVEDVEHAVSEVISRRLTGPQPLRHLLRAHVQVAARVRRSLGIEP